MNDIDVVAMTILVSSGAGFLLGKHFEKQRAMRAFSNFRSSVMGSAMATTQAVMNVMKKRLPDVTAEDLMKDMVREGKELGITLVAVNSDTKQVINGDDNKTE